MITRECSSPSFQRASAIPKNSAKYIDVKFGRRRKNAQSSAGEKMPIPAFFSRTEASVATTTCLGNSSRWFAKRPDIVLSGKYLALEFTIEFIYSKVGNFNMLIFNGVSQDWMLTACGRLYFDHDWTKKAAGYCRKIICDRDIGSLFARRYASTVNTLKR